MMSALLLRSSADIESLIPHAGAMCLLDRVLEWDRDGIVCETQTHRLPDNPLRNTRGLPITAALEYAAQAVALHGSLMCQSVEQGEQTVTIHEPPVQPRGGYLAVLSHVNWQQDWLDTETEFLRISVKKEAQSSAGVDCSFVVSCEERILVQGSMVVAFIS
jgi:predicted hotdog family 3-hydroxylacyl-ACP dehydratase